MAANPEKFLLPGVIGPELVPVVDPEALALLQGGTPSLHETLALNEILDDALFGEVIDISELIPGVLSESGTHTAELASAPFEPAGVGLDLSPEPVGDLSVALSVLYDDDILASDNGIL